MVFQKLTDEQKQQLFDLKEFKSKESIASIRALVMRGASMAEAKKEVVEREKAKNDYIDQIDKEMKIYQDNTKGADNIITTIEKEEAKAETSPKPKRGRKAKKTEEEITNYATSETQIALVEEPAPTKRKRGKKAVAQKNTPPEDTTPEDTPPEVAQEVKPKRGRKPRDFNVELTI